MGLLQSLESIDLRASGHRVAAPSHRRNRERWSGLTAARRGELRRMVQAFEHPEDPHDLLMVADMTITTIRRLVLLPVAERWPGRAKAEQLWLEDLLVYAHNLVGAIFATWLAAGDPDDPDVRHADQVVGMLSTVEDASSIRLGRLRHDVGRLPIVSLVLAFVFAVTMGASFVLPDRQGELLLVVSYIALGSALIPNVLYRRRRRGPVRERRASSVGVKPAGSAPTSTEG